MYLKKLKEKKAKIVEERGCLIKEVEELNKKEAVVDELIKEAEDEIKEEAIEVSEECEPDCDNVEDTEEVREISYGAR